MAFASLKGTWHRIGSAPPEMPIPPNFSPEDLAKRRPPAASNAGSPPPFPPPAPPSGAANHFAAASVPMAGADASRKGVGMVRLAMVLFPIFIYVMFVIPASQKDEPLGMPLGILGVAVIVTIKALWDTRVKKG